MGRFLFPNIFFLLFGFAVNCFFFFLEVLCDLERKNSGSSEGCNRKSAKIFQWPHRPCRMCPQVVNEGMRAAATSIFSRFWSNLFEQLQAACLCFVWTSLPSTKQRLVKYSPPSGNKTKRKRRNLSAPLLPLWNWIIAFARGIEAYIESLSICMYIFEVIGTTHVSLLDRPPTVTTTAIV